MAPFPAQLLGRAAGEEFQVRRPDGVEVRYRVEKIENALAGGDWDDDSVKPA